MRQLDTTYHSGMAGYLMDFGFGGFIGYGKGVSVQTAGTVLFCLKSGRAERLRPFGSFSRNAW